MKGSKRALLVGVSMLLASGVATSAGATSTPSGRAAASTIPAAACAANRAAGTVTFVSPFSYDASAGILDVVAAKSLDYFADECLNVQLVMNSYTATSLVSAGTGTITGVGSAADTLRDIADGGHFVGVLTFGDTSDYAILTRKNITSLTQLQGKVLGYHSPIPVALLEMLQAAKVNAAKVKEVNDTSYDPTVLIKGPYQGLQAYQSNEPITLRAGGYQFNEFLPSQFGVQGTFNIQVVNRTFLTKHPVAVADFLRAELHAYDYCTVHIAACVAMEASAAKAGGVTYDNAHETAEWRFETGLVATHTLAGKGVGVESSAEWSSEAAALVANGIVKKSAIPAWAEDSSLLPSLYHGKTLIWPGS